MTRIIKIGTRDCVCQESQTCLTSTAVIPTSLEDGAIFYAATETSRHGEAGDFFPLAGALAFAQLLSSFFACSGPELLSIVTFHDCPMRPDVL